MFKKGMYSLLALILAGCSQAGQGASQTNAGESTTESTTVLETSSQEEQVPNYRELYGPVFGDYKTLFNVESTFAASKMQLNVALNSWAVEDIVDTPNDNIYAYYDINGDGLAELLMASPSQNAQNTRPILRTIYYLKDGKEPTVLSEGYVAGHGGARANTDIYPGGKVLSQVWSSGSGDGKVSVLEIGQKGASINVNATQDFTQLNIDWKLLGLDKDAYMDLSQLNWRSIRETFVNQTDGGNIPTLGLLALQAGDYSAWAGTWQKGDGKQITLDDKGLVTLSSGLQWTLDAPEINRGEDGSFVRRIGLGQYFAEFYFIPAGVILPPWKGESGKIFNDASDSSKNRILIERLGERANADDFYYRVDANTQNGQ